MNKLDKHLTEYFESYVQSAVDNDCYGCCVADSICYYSQNIKQGIEEFILENFPVLPEPKVCPLEKLVDLVFENLLPEDYSDVEIGHTFSKTTELDLVFSIQEIECQIPEELMEFESEEYHVNGDLAYCVTDEILIYRPDNSILHERVEEAIEELTTEE